MCKTHNNEWINFFLFLPKCVQNVEEKTSSQCHIISVALRREWMEKESGKQGCLLAATKAVEMKIVAIVIMLKGELKKIRLEKLRFSWRCWRESRKNGKNCKSRMNTRLNFITFYFTKEQNLKEMMMMRNEKILVATEFTFNQKQKKSFQQFMLRIET